MPVEVSEAQVHEIVERWQCSESFVIEMLQDVQHEARHLPRSALEQISREVGVPMARLYHLATFFKAFSLEPRGEHMVQVCVGSACHVKGAPRLVHACERHLGIKSGETTEDGKFSLEPVRCLGCCGLAAVLTIDDELHGHVTSANVERLLKRFMKQEKKVEVK
jgi:NADH-quinone oxidoreductase subunit E